MAKSRQDAVGVNCAKVANGKVLVENDQVKEEWRKYMEKLLNDENTWDNAHGATGIVSEMFTAEEHCSVEWLTSLRNLIVAQGRIPDDWRSSCYRFSKGKEIQ